MNFCILGAGAWGTAVAIYLSKIGQLYYQVRLVEVLLSIQVISLSHLDWIHFE